MGRTRKGIDFLLMLKLEFDGRRLEIKRNKRKGRIAYLFDNTDSSVGCTECCLLSCCIKMRYNDGICKRLKIKEAKHFENGSKSN